MRETRNTRRRKGAAGFTLIELMVVVVIIGVLAALVGPAVMKQADKSKVEAAKTQITHFKTALSMYKLEGNSYPTTSQGLEALIHNDLGEQFLEQDSVPLDPWGNPYIYISPGAEGHDFEIICYGADGAKGGAGLDADILSYDLAAAGK